MKKIIMIILMSLMLTVPVYATTLDEVTSIEQATEQVTEQATETSAGLSEESRSFISGINNAAKISEHSGDVSKVSNLMTRAVGKFITLASYALILGLSATTVLDLVYIVIPVLRTTLSGGRVGVAQHSGQQVPSSYEQVRQNQVQGTSNQGNANRNNALSTKQWVSDEALTAVASAQSVDQASGKPMNPLKIYAKAMTVKLVAVPILIVLAVTGILNDLGFFLADKICTAIYSLINNSL